ncbi:uncharacterized protein N7477_001756 [Penicillium maclennaniae]|uniref:uncharacterized protein n=1 Tax=Penicillium maclennaniae TaxID=1343394 RepID=UPI00253FB1AD|nr:uncharacterized protein N7477_001756 [Penicillium maclennaniae]KAJ5681816.1 hypothetical protein N7477_001756 [Penicillium maclennaniae]
MNIPQISTNKQVQIDYEQLANLAGITKASARTMYPKAKKKLAAFQAACPVMAAADTTGTDPDTPVLAEKSAGPRRYKRRKVTKATTADMNLSHTQRDIGDAELSEALKTAVEGIEVTEAAELVTDDEI